MKEDVCLLLTADEKYARQCAVTLLSVLCNAKIPDSLHVFLLSPDISPSSAVYLKAICDSFGAKIDIFAIDLNLFKDLPITYGHFNLNIYSRLYGPHLCKECDVLLYLDCDLIVLGDISELLRLDLRGKSLGAVPHVSLPYQKEFSQKFPVQGEDRYFNTGVMLINAANWRDQDIFGLAMDLANKYSDEIEFPDQDILNFIFWKDYFHLPGVWNVESRLYKEKLLGISQDMEVEQRLQNPQVVHFTGAKKPWLSREYVPMRHLYRQYSDRLATEFNWNSSTKEPGQCGFVPFLSFLWACFYFRLALLKQNML